MTPPPYPHLGLSLSVLQGAMRELILSTGEGGSQCGKCVRVRQRLCFHLGPGTAPDSTEIKSIFFPFTLSPDGARSLHGTCEVGMFSGEQPGCLCEGAALTVLPLCLLLPVPLPSLLL